MFPHSHDLITIMTESSVLLSLHIRWVSIFKYSSMIYWCLLLTFTCILLWSYQVHLLTTNREQNIYFWKWFQISWEKFPRHWFYLVSSYTTNLLISVYFLSWVFDIKIIKIYLSTPISPPSLPRDLRRHHWNIRINDEGYLSYFGRLAIQPFLPIIYLV